MNKPKWWGKSKTVILGSIQTVQGFLAFALAELHTGLSGNMEFIKSSGIEPKWIFLLMGLNGLLFIILRSFTKAPIATKKGVENADNPDNQAVS